MSQILTQRLRISCQKMEIKKSLTERHHNQHLIVEEEHDKDTVIMCCYTYNDLF